MHPKSNYGFLPGLFSIFSKCYPFSQISSKTGKRKQRAEDTKPLKDVTSDEHSEATVDISPSNQSHNSQSFTPKHSESFVVRMFRNIQRRIMNRTNQTTDMQPLQQNATSPDTNSARNRTSRSSSPTKTRKSLEKAQTIQTDDVGPSNTLKLDSETPLSQANRTPTPIKSGRVPRNKLKKAQTFQADDVRPSNTLKPDRKIPYSHGNRSPVPIKSGSVTRKNFEKAQTIQVDGVRPLHTLKPDSEKPSSQGKRSPVPIKTGNVPKINLKKAHTFQTDNIKPLIKTSTGQQNTTHKQTTGNTANLQVNNKVSIRKNRKNPAEDTQRVSYGQNRKPVPSPVPSPSTQQTNGSLRGSFRVKKQSIIASYVDLEEDCTTRYKPRASVVSRDNATSSQSQKKWQKSVKLVSAINQLKK